MVSPRNNRRLPPYVSYRTFHNFLEGLQQQGIPARIDRSYWGDRLSGSTGSQLLAALRFMNLVDNEGIPTSRLKQLIAARGTQKNDILKQLTTECYAFVLQGGFDPQTATYSQLEEALHDTYQIGGDVSRKCIKFFINLANDSGIYLSPFVTKKSNNRSSSGTKKITKKISGKQDNVSRNQVEANKDSYRIPMDKILVEKFPIFDPSWPNEVKLKWFDGFDQLLQRFLQPDK